MNKLKKFSLIVVAVMLMAILSCNMMVMSTEKEKRVCYRGICQYADDGYGLAILSTGSATWTDSTKGDLHISGIRQIFKWDNVFCVEKGQNGGHTDNVIVGSIHIRGKELTLKDWTGSTFNGGAGTPRYTQTFDGYSNPNSTVSVYDGTKYTTITISEMTNMANQIAAIFNTTGLKGNYDDPNGFGTISPQQFTLWYKWNEFVRSLPADGNGSGIWDWGGSAGVFLQGANNWDAWMQERASDASANWTAVTNNAKNNNYSLDIYYLRETAHTWQAIIMTEKPKTQTINIPVTKVWVDDNNIDKIRPTSINVKLYKNGSSTNQTRELSVNNGWKNSFDNLPKTDSSGKTITYTVKEELETDNGYKTEISGTMSSGFTITNTAPEKITVPVKKIWEDNNNQDGKRPTQITIKLYADGQDTGKTLTLKGPNWEGTFTNLLKYKEQKEIVYTVKEVLDTNTEQEYDTGEPTKDSTGTWVINNKHIPEKINIIVEKEWDDNGNSDDKRPTEITVSLYAEGVSGTLKTVKLRGSDTDGTWTGTFEGLDRYKNGSEIKYYVRETAVSGYNTPVYAEKTVKKGTPTVYTYKIKNSYETEKINITVSKTWDDNDDRDGIRPASITVRLKADGVDTGKTITLSQSNNWTNTFKDLNKYKYPRQKITYTVTEDKVSGYETTIEPQSIVGTNSTNKSENHTVKITNKHTPSAIDLTISKIWDDEGDRDRKRPESITIYLKATANGQRIYAYNLNDELIGTKATDSTGKICNKIVINAPAEHFTNNGELKEPWESYIVKDLYKYHPQGNLITYTVEEIKINYYEDSIDYGNGKTGIVGSKTTNVTESVDESYTIKITNKYVPEKINIPVRKEWQDDTDRDGLRKSITLVLKGNGTEVARKTLTLGEGQYTRDNNVWEYTFENVYKYTHRGQLIEYTIEEQHDMERYETILPTHNIKGSTQIGNTTTDGFTIINKHDPEIMKVNIIKKWEDTHDLDEYRPDEVTFELLENGQPSKYAEQAKPVGSASNRNSVGDIVITDPIKSGAEYSATWGEYTVTNLFRYYNHGTPIEYTVVEGEINEYNESNDQPQIDTDDCDLKSDSTKAAPGEKVTTITVTNTHEPKYDGYIEITGTVWEDLRDGKANDVNGIFDDDEKGLSGIKVILRDENGNYFDDKESSETSTDDNGNYTIKVNYDTTTNVYKLHNDPSTVESRLAKAYIEFEYDGMKYTTVATATIGEDTSKAKEDEKSRLDFDGNHKTVTPTTYHPDDEEDQEKEWVDKYITAKTEEVIDFANYSDKTEKTVEEVLKYCNGDGTYERTNPEGAWIGNPNTDDKYLISDKYNPSTKHPDHTKCETSGHNMNTYDVQVEIIQNVNLGLFKREQPDVAIFSELSKVEVTMNSQQYTYLYNSRTTVTDEKAKEAYEQAYQDALRKGMSEEAARRYAEQKKIQVKFENKDVYTYRRPINPADIAYVNKLGDENTMTVFVTYKVRVANTSSTLKMTVHNIINSYDSGYSIETQGWTDITTGDKFNEAKYNGDLNIELEPLKDKELELTYSVNFETIKSLLKGEATLNNVVEVESFTTTYGENTLYAEQRTGGRTEKPYAGYDYDSKPGNADIEFKTAEEIKSAYESAGKEYKEAGKDRLYSYQEVTPKGLEDDTDIAPSFGIIPDKEKRLSGTVWEDSDYDIEDDERIGDGKQAEDEKNLLNAKVELYKVNDDGTASTNPAILYKINEDGTISEKSAVTYSKGDGYYTFGEDGYSVVTDTYLIKFTYGEGILKEDNSTTISSSINGLNVNARNYKSTIISSKEENKALYDVFKNGTTDYEWHLKTTKGYSIAVDDMNERIKIEDLQYSNFSDAIHMTAYSKPFKMQVEFDGNSQKTASVGTDGETKFAKELNIFDLGIIERPREDIFVEKTIDYVKLTLSNGQVLVEGNPKESLNYVKAIGFNKTIMNGLEARKAISKRMVIEMDAQLIQQAQLNIKYLITVTNNSEKDFDYYVNDQIKTEYYYFGTNNENSPMIKNSVNQLIDYIDTDYNFNWKYSDKWTEVSADDLKVDGKKLVSDETIEAITNNNYKAYITEMFSEVGPGESKSDYAYASKLLANQDENKYENHIEILQIDAKIARTIGIDKDGNTILKQYKPGDYIPSTSNRYLVEYEAYDDFANDSNGGSRELGEHQQDDDRVEVVITPPTGITEYITKYLVAGLVGMLVISIGVIFIKKKVLVK